MTTPEIGPVDTPPTDGVFRDWDGAQLEPEVIAEGNRIGAETPDFDYIEGDDGERVPL